ncbi:DNA topoisomerase 1 [Salvelinus sp. IW2-2015]|nr:DNA topoisomerase 1 [Salvelinus alpinus]
MSGDHGERDSQVNSGSRANDAHKHKDKHKEHRRKEHKKDKERDKAKHSSSEHREHSEKKHRDKEKERLKHSDGSVDRHREKQKEKDREKREVKSSHVEGKPKKEKENGHAREMWNSPSPPAIKSEPEEDNGLYPSPKHNKTLKRERDEEEFEYKPKKIKTENGKKRKQEEEDIKPKKKTKDKKAGADGKKAKKETEEKWKWWEEERSTDGSKWKFLEHKGPVLAPPYEPLPGHVRFFYDGKLLRLSAPAEEVATFFAKMLDHEYTTKEMFRKNFYKDWRKEMTSEEKSKITDINKCNFTEISEYFKAQSEARKQMSKDEKLKIKEENERILQEYGFCVMDNHKERIGNFRIEPPGLFRGRGDHPKMGMLKRRIRPEDIIINCSK